MEEKSNGKEPVAGVQEQRAQVLAVLRSKSCMKQDVYRSTMDMYDMLKELLQEIAVDLEREIMETDRRISINFMDKGGTSCELKVAGDVIIFHMHTNVFRLDQSHWLWKGDYLKEDELRGFFGVINIYNFLSDSFKYNRERDLGYMVARLFLNKEGHFFMQGKRQLDRLYRDLPGSTMDREKLKEILYSVIIYVLEFDLLAPPYDQVNQVTVSEMHELNAPQLSTGKRLGFRSQVQMDPRG
jgi:hypothetical protein